FGGPEAGACRFWTTLEVEAREPADGTDHSDEDGSVLRHLGLGQSGSDDREPVVVHPSLMGKRMRRRLEPRCRWFGTRRALRHVEGCRGDCPLPWPPSGELEAQAVVE